MNGTPRPDATAQRKIVGKSQPRSAGMSLVVALVSSAAVHATVLLLPYLGRGVSATVRPMPAVRYAVTVRLEKPAKPPDDRQEVADDRKPAQSPQPETRGQAEQPLPGAIGANLLPIPGTRFYPTEELSKRPQPAVAVDFDAPELGGIAQAGKIVLRLWIDENGGVADVKLEKTDLPETITGPIVAIFRRSQFLPGERGGKRVGSIMKIEVDIDPRPPLR